MADGSLRVGVNALFVRHGRVGGAEQMLVSLLEGFDEISSPNEVWQAFSREPLVLRTPLRNLHLRTQPERPRLNRIVYEALEVPRLPRPDVWLHTNYFTPIGTIRPSITVIHDAQYADLPENFSRAKRAWLAAAHRQTLLTAHDVVVISDFTRRQLLRLHGPRLARKVHVIPNPVSFRRLAAGRAPTSVPDGAPFILSVAAHYRHKNLRTLLQAYEILRRGTEVRLVLVGQSRDNLVAPSTGQDAMPSTPPDGVIFTGYVGDVELGALYEHAAVFAFPSVFEGFGLPIVEALGKRVPTVTTRCGAIPEVGGSHPLYVENPFSPEELAYALVTALDDPDSARPDIDAAERLRAKFAPKAIAQRYAELLRAM